MSLILYSTHTLDPLYPLLAQLEDAHYAEPLAILSGGSIGKHVRHVLEFYLCLFKGLPKGLVDYEKRERNLLLENHTAAAQAALDDILYKLTALPTDSPLLLCVSAEIPPVPSSLYRELLYNIEHCVHHLAIIRIALENHFPTLAFAPELGVAASTLRYRNLGQAVAMKEGQ